ncbi:hypothetical protein IWQ61_002021 [Dispira simplex]|nr:hypothetical protein IWQ61_002021 [Dispira simplex]
MKTIIIIIGALAWLTVRTQAGIVDRISAIPGMISALLGMGPVGKEIAWCNDMFKSLQSGEELLFGIVVGALCTSSHRKAITLSTFKDELRVLTPDDTFTLMSNEIKQLGYMIHKDYHRLPERRDRFEKHSKKVRQLTDDDVEKIKQNTDLHHQNCPLGYNAVMEEEDTSGKFVDRQSSFLVNVHVYKKSKKVLSDDDITLRKVDFTTETDRDLLRVSPYMLALRHKNYGVAEALVENYQFKLKTIDTHAKFLNSSIQPFVKSYRDYLSKVFKYPDPSEKFEDSALFRNAHDNIVKYIFWPAQAMVALLNKDIDVFQRMLSKKIVKKNTMYYDAPKELVFLAIAKAHSDSLYNQVDNLLHKYIPSLFENYPEETKLIGEDIYSFQEDFLAVYNIEGKKQFNVIDAVNVHVN